MLYETSKYVVSFTVVCHLHRVTTVTRGLVKKLSTSIFEFRQVTLVTPKHAPQMSSAL